MSAEPATCPPLDGLLAAREGHLSEAEARAIVHHAESCAACQNEMRVADRVFEVYRRVDDVRVQAQLARGAERLHAALAQPPAGRPFLDWTTLRRWLPAAAAFVLIIVGTLVTGVPRSRAAELLELALAAEYRHPAEVTTPRARLLRLSPDASLTPFDTWIGILDGREEIPPLVKQLLDQYSAEPLSVRGYHQWRLGQRGWRETSHEGGGFVVLETSTRSGNLRRVTLTLRGGDFRLVAVTLVGLTCRVELEPATEFTRMSRGRTANREVAP